MGLVFFIQSGVHLTSERQRCGLAASPRLAMAGQWGQDATWLPERASFLMLLLPMGNVVACLGGCHFSPRGPQGWRV